MDKSTRIGYILILVLFLGFLYFNNDNQEELERMNEEVVDATPEPTVQEESTTVNLEDTVVTEEVVEVAPEVFTSLSNDVMSIDFSSKGGSPYRVELKKYHRYDSSELVLFDSGQSRMNYIIPMANGSTVYTENLNFVGKLNDSGSLVYTADLGNGAQFIQTYSLKEGSYLLDYDVRFENMDRVVAPNNRFATLKWSSKVQGQEKTIKDEHAVTSVYYRFTADEDIDNLSETKADDEKLQGNLKWVSFKQKFFNQTLIHDESFTEDGVLVEVKEAEDETYVKELSTQMYFSLEQNRNTEDMAFYFGPNHYQTLKKQKIGLEQLVPLGWGIFGWVNKLLVIPIFNFLEGYFTSYGLIILLLTITIKLMLFFPMYKVYKSTAKMRLLKPELDEIKERTGGDMQKMQQEQMKLYKQAGVSPLGGCLPQLVQLPILFAMFRFFPASIELRQEKLWWADDLSSYDSIFDFPGGFEIPFYGDHVSLFTLLMTAVTLFYTVVNSKNSGQMVGPMKMVMYIMPIMFLGFFNNYAAALSFYYFLSTSITIVQNFVIRKFVIDEDRLHRQIQESKKKKVSVKKSNFQKRLEDMAKKRGVDPYTGKQKNAPAPKKGKGRK